MAHESQYSANPDSAPTPRSLKRKYKDDRPTGSSDGPDAAVPPPPSYNSVPPPSSDLDCTKRPTHDNGSVDSIDVKGSYSSHQGSGAGKRIDIPNGRVGGETIKYLQLQSGAKIQVTRDMGADPNSATRTVELMGSPDAIATAEKLINEVLAEAETGGSGIVARRVAGQAQSDEYVTKIPNNKAEKMHIEAANVTSESSDSDSYDSDDDPDVYLSRILYPPCPLPPDLSWSPPPDTREDSFCRENDDDKDCKPDLYPSVSPPPDTDILCSIENMPTRPVSHASPMANQLSSVRSKAEEMHIDIANVTGENSVNNLQPVEISDHVSDPDIYADMCNELSVFYFLSRPINRLRISYC